MESDGAEVNESCLLGLSSMKVIEYTSSLSQVI